MMMKKKNGNAKRKRASLLLRSHAVNADAWDEDDFCGYIRWSAAFKMVTECFDIVSSEHSISVAAVI